MRSDPFGKLMDVLRHLEAAGIAFRVTHNRSDSITVEATVPGERWEIDVLEDGEIDFERFVSSGDVSGEEEMAEAIAKWAETMTEAAE